MEVSSSTQVAQHSPAFVSCEPHRGPRGLGPVRRQTFLIHWPRGSGFPSSARPQPGPRQARSPGSHPPRLPRSAKAAGLLLFHGCVLLSRQLCPGKDESSENTAVGQDALVSPDQRRQMFMKRRTHWGKECVPPRMPPLQHQPINHLKRPPQLRRAWPQARKRCRGCKTPREEWLPQSGLLLELWLLLSLF